MSAISQSTLFSATSADAIAGRDAGIDQRRGGGDGFGTILLPGQIVPDAVPLASQSGSGAETLGLAAMQLDQIAAQSWVCRVS